MSDEKMREEFDAIWKDRSGLDEHSSLSYQGAFGLWKLCAAQQSAEIERLSAQVGRLRDALDKARNGIVWYSENSDDADDSDTEMLCEIDEALSVTSADAEAWKRGVQAEALEEAIKTVEYLEEKSEKWNRHKIPELRDDSLQAFGECLSELRRMAKELRGE